MEVTDIMEAMAVTTVVEAAVAVEVAAETVTLPKNIMVDIWAP
jgi:Na+-transporting NADH:ubiquinone oxidoreductase subunit NqrD